MLTRRMYGGLAQVSVVMSTMMGGISGSATADAAMETRMLGPSMLERGYSKGYITAVNCLTGLITATIPPSLGLIIYGFVGEVSIGRLFAAGIIPGILMMFTLMLTVNLTARRKKYDAPNPDTPKLTGKELLGGLKESVWALIFPVILIVGIRFGVCTPSEAGAFAVVYAILIGVFVYREMTFKSFCDALLMSMMDNAAVMMLVAMSGPFSYAGYVCQSAAVARVLYLRHYHPAAAAVHHHSGVPVYHGSVPGQQRELPAADPDFPADDEEGWRGSGAFWRADGDDCYHGRHDSACRFGTVYGLRHSGMPG